MTDRAGDLVGLAVNHEAPGGVEVVALLNDEEDEIYIAYFFATTLTEAVRKAFTPRPDAQRDYNIGALPAYLKDFYNAASEETRLLGDIASYYASVVV